MDFSSLGIDITIDDIQHLLQQYRALGPFPGVLFPFLESFLPVLPLMVIVVANAAAYGFLLGSFLSWVGTCAGSILVFLIFRKLSDKRFGHFVRRSAKVNSTLEWVNRHGFGPLFLLYCFPFTPSSLVNTASGLAKINMRSFILAVALGKMIMIFIVSYIGYNWVDLFTHPVKILIVSIIVIILWIVGKVIENHLQKSHKSSEME